MGHVVFDVDPSSLEPDGGAADGAATLRMGARGPVIRTPYVEVRKNFYPAKLVAGPHEHPEEQFLYVLSGRAHVTLGDQTYVVGPGEGSFHPSGVAHRVEILEDLTALSFKNQPRRPASPAQPAAAANDPST